MKRFTHIICLFFLLYLSMPLLSHAQVWNFDVSSVEALIDDHKAVRSSLFARSSVEQANEVLHQYSSETAVNYDSLNVKLDKYTKCFDIIDIIYNGGKTVLNVYNTSDDVSQKIADLNKLIAGFISDYTLNGNILPSDTIIIRACQNAVKQVKEEGSGLVNSLLELGQYAVGVQVKNVQLPSRHITTEGLLTVIGSINEHLDAIRGVINSTYYIVWRYITLRRTYFKASLFAENSRSVADMAADAFKRWKGSASKVGFGSPSLSN